MNKRRRYKAKRRRLARATRRRYNDQILGFMRYLKGRVRYASVFNRLYDTVFPMPDVLKDREVGISIRLIRQWDVRSETILRVP